LFARHKGLDKPWAWGVFMALFAVFLPLMAFLRPRARSAGGRGVVAFYALMSAVQVVLLVAFVLFRAFGSVPGCSGDEARRGMAAFLEDRGFDSSSFSLAGSFRTAGEGLETQCTGTVRLEDGRELDLEWTIRPSEDGREWTMSVTFARTLRT
jgi:hypothetical protein